VVATKCLREQLWPNGGEVGVGRREQEAEHAPAEGVVPLPNGLRDEGVVLAELLERIAADQFVADKMSEECYCILNVRFKQFPIFFNYIFLLNFINFYSFINTQ
jgi:hypothetical protein